MEITFQQVIVAIIVLSLWFFVSYVWKQKRSEKNELEKEIDHATGKIDEAQEEIEEIKEGKDETTENLNNSTGGKSATSTIIGIFKRGNSK
jgi:peptidoglycan hydrolase CwlO-like protein